MKHRILFLLLILCSLQSIAQDQSIYKANHPYIQYFGRIQKPDPSTYRFWQPGVYIKAQFHGTYCNLIITDEMLNGQHNSIAIQIDNKPVKKVELTQKNNMIPAATNLPDGDHVVTICKNTEAGIGYIDFMGIQCAKLITMDYKPNRRLEFIGNSITCGADSDPSTTPCGKGQWYDQSNAYMSYGPLTARKLDAQWQLSSVSGIGLIHSCCDMKITMPQVFDKINMRDNAIPWDFGKYQPHVVTVCLGQNDGKQDSVKFCSAFLQFIGKIRKVYPKASIVLLNSPMADDGLNKVLQNYIKGIVTASKDKEVSYYFFKKRYHGGCNNHPSLAEHQLIANELSAYIKRLKQWQ